MTMTMLREIAGNRTQKGSLKFDVILRKLIDDSGVMARNEWAKVLAVSEPAISQWLTGKTVPRPETLRAILRVLRNVTTPPRKILREFDVLAGAPAREVTEHFARVGPTLAHYMLSPVLRAFLSTLETLPTSDQERVLLRASSDCRKRWKRREQSPRTQRRVRRNSIPQ